MVAFRCALLAAFGVLCVVLWESFGQGHDPVETAFIFIVLFAILGYCLDGLCEERDQLHQLGRPK